MSRLNERHAKVLQLRLFGSLNLNEIAETLGISPNTASADWRTARAWFLRYLAAS